MKLTGSYAPLIHPELAQVMPDCWLEVSLHPEDPVSGQLQQCFPWFSSDLGHCTLHMQPSLHGGNIKINSGHKQ
jgi:hypothetical protein